MCYFAFSLVDTDATIKKNLLFFLHTCDKMEIMTATLKLDQEKFKQRNVSE